MFMFISIPSLRNYIFVNGFLICLSLCQNSSISYYEKNINQSLLNNFFFILFIFLCRNNLLLNFVEYGTKNKVKICDDQQHLPKEEYEGEFNVNLVTTTSIEVLTHIFIKKTLIFDDRNINFYQQALHFVPISFVFDVLFDLFHYIGHRIFHHKYFYCFFHKKHHKFNHPIAITTFYQDPIDLIITNSIPTIIALYFTPSIFYTQFNIIVVYKNFIEISGHSGKWSYPTSSFPQCIWLPKLLRIELYTEDHDLHHSLNSCNYAKRFSLWDKSFGTYKENKI
jgi:sterol desaturase/sphingolipid hydroxylase (fatty acid hydroxylase superfamily)